MEVLLVSVRSTLPLRAFPMRSPEVVMIAPIGPEPGPWVGNAPRSPTPAIPERPVVGDCGRKLKESEIWKIQ
jgi:hypothetical protein